MTDETRKLARNVRALILDMDGVLTDGRIYYGPTGETKAFDAKDATGLAMLRREGIVLGVITSSDSEVNRRLARDFGFRHVYLGATDKETAFREIMRQDRLLPTDYAYMGDDRVDVPLMRLAGLALAPANAIPEAQEAAHYVTAKLGGAGAVREVCDLIIEARA